MGKLTTIFKDTAIYGLSSIIGRFLNYLLVPLYTAQLSAASGGYGIITNIYAYVALMMVLLTFGMETTYFRFTNKTHTDSQTVYGTTLISVGSISLLFALIVLALLSPISQIMGYGDHPDYVGVMAVTVAIDAFLCIPFAHLRQQKKAVKFAALKLLNIVVSIQQVYIVVGINQDNLLGLLTIAYIHNVHAIQDTQIVIGPDLGILCVI